MEQPASELSAVLAPRVHEEVRSNTSTCPRSIFGLASPQRVLRLPVRLTPTCAVQVCECLSLGMSFFYAVERDRIDIMSGLVKCRRVPLW
jgi:hypothetical protein